MESYLKTKKVRIAHLDKEFEICELSARAWMELMELHRSGGTERLGAVLCKHGVVGWSGETVEDIEKALPAKAMQEITDAIYELSGVDSEKNSESAPKEGSSLGLRAI